MDTSMFRSTGSGSAMVRQGPDWSIDGLLSLARPHDMTWHDMTSLAWTCLWTETNFCLVSLSSPFGAQQRHSFKLPFSSVQKQHGFEQWLSSLKPEDRQKVGRVIHLVICLFACLLFFFYLFKKCISNLYPYLGITHTHYWNNGSLFFAT